MTIHIPPYNVENVAFANATVRHGGRRYDGVNPIKFVVIDYDAGGK